MKRRFLSLFLALLLLFTLAGCQSSSEQEDAQKDAPPVCHSLDILYPKIRALILNRSHMLLLKQMLYPLIGKLLSMHLPLAAMTY